MERNQGNELDTTGDCWWIWREDIHGNQVRMPERFDTQADADALCDVFTERGHHQIYTVRPNNPDDPREFIAVGEAR